MNTDLPDRRHGQKKKDHQKAAAFLLLITMMSLLWLPRAI
jgi:hypothetical protein